MKTTVHNPATGIYAATLEYVHAVELTAPQRFLFTAGTMGLDERGTPPPGLTDQLELVWENLRVILAHAGMTPDHIVRLTTYLRDAADADENAAARMRALGGRPVPTTVIVAETLSPHWLVEIEVLAAA